MPSPPNAAKAAIWWGYPQPRGLRPLAGALGGYNRRESEAFGGAARRAAIHGGFVRAGVMMRWDWVFRGVRVVKVFNDPKVLKETEAATPLTAVKLRAQRAEAGASRHVWRLYVRMGA